MEYLIYTDESIKRGKYYSNFYGGAMVSGKDVNEINKLLEEKKYELGFHSEIKWSKVTANYLDKYIEIMTFFFKLIKQNIVKIRIMFTHNCNVPNNLTKDQRDNEFFLLYYQFLKHSFGLQYCGREYIRLKLFFDKLPDTKEKNQRFKDYIYNLQFDSNFASIKLDITEENIVEVDSKKHVILQCMDIILGSMQFRLNDQHKEKPPGKFRRAKKTIAKEKLYKHINRLINEIYPNFNIGISTGVSGELENKWVHPYRHWCFQPNDFEYDETKTKRYEEKPHRSY